MSDLYSELLVKKDQTIADKLVRGGMITLVVLCALAGILLTPSSVVCSDDTGNSRLLYSAIYRSGI